MANETVYRASTTAPVNIAVIKYWGKRDAKLNLPSNSSLSVTLSQEDLRTHTTASCSANYKGSPDSLILNGESQDINTPRTQACLRSLRGLRAGLEKSNASLPQIASLPLNLVSSNNFPTAAGLASSAAGFAALVRAIANLYELPSSPTDLSRIARQGSGSACRSLFGGYVAWQKGDLVDGSDSQAVEIASASHWPEMRALILVASSAKKAVGSTVGMQATVATSTLFKTRADSIVPQRMQEMEKAIKDRDFESFGKITMRESNSFHATCLDTEPPIFYLNDTSRAAIKVVESLNAASGRIIAAYTFDAGPNAVVYFLEKDEGQVAGVLKSALGGLEGWDTVAGKAVPKTPSDKVEQTALQLLKDGISRVIYTKVGEGPVQTDEHLITPDGQMMK